MEKATKYMVEFDIFKPFEKEMLELIPKQRERVEYLFQTGSLLSYSFTKDRSNLWAVFVVDSESELMSLIDSLPMTRFMDYDYKELMLYSTISYLPSLSMN